MKAHFETSFTRISLIYYNPGAVRCMKILSHVALLSPDIFPSLALANFPEDFCFLAPLVWIEVQDPSL